MLIKPESKARSHHLLLTHKDSARSRHTHDIYLLLLLRRLLARVLHLHHASSKLLLHTILLLWRVAHLLLVGAVLAHNIALRVHIIIVSDPDDSRLLLHFNLIRQNGNMQNFFYKNYNFKFLIKF